MTDFLKYTNDTFGQSKDLFDNLSKPYQLDTSAEAKRSIAPHLGKMKSRVLRSLHVDGNATDDELEQRLEMSHQSLSACRRGCVKDELVQATGKSRPTRSGCSANIWTITELGIVKLYCGDKNENRRR